MGPDQLGSLSSDQCKNRFLLTKVVRFAHVKSKVKVRDRVICQALIHLYMDLSQVI